VSAIDSVIKRIQPGRLMERLERLYQLGREDGSAGAMRLAFSAADRRGRDYALGLMRQADLSPRIDAAGNLIGVRRGASGKPAALIIGSHLDTVPNGGMFDGALGVIGGIEVLAAMAEAGVVPHHSIEAISFSNEEKARFATTFGGSLAMVRGVSASEVDPVRDPQGFSLAEAMQASGLDPARVNEARRPAGFCRAYLELHIEQGGRMLKTGHDIGVVTAIVGITRAKVTFRGRANHAGTTAMEDRRDALWAAAALVGDVREAALAQAGELVGTVGQLRALPGAANVVPGEAVMMIELRSTDEALTARTLDSLLARAREHAERWRLEVEIESGRVGRAVPMDESVQAAIEAAAARSGLKHQRMASWAGHDASTFAAIAPTGMIFVPSQGGISHSPDESTLAEHAVAGVKTLAGAVLTLDQKFAGGVD
jgi:hydantoinase/carbamoylase family amidase